MKNTPILLLSILLVLFFNSCIQTDTQKEKEPTYLLDICIDSLETEEFHLNTGENISVILGKEEISPLIIDSLSNLSKDVFDISKMKAGQSYTLLRDTLNNNTHYLIYQHSLTEYVVFRTLPPLEVYAFNKPIKNKDSEVAGEITSSLWNAMSEANISPLMALKLSDIFAWEIDFFGIAKGDKFALLYQEGFIDDTTSVGINNIDGALFLHGGKKYYAIPFEQDGVLDYFDENGQSLRKAFLKAPLKFSRISSKFSNSRLHPVLKIYRPHHGVDYAARKGTPVVSIGSGRVIKKAYQPRGGGNYLVIRHNKTYTTTYMHLSKFAKGIKQGSMVEQGELIGYVGNTGLASGPHLDFRVHKNGTPINPLKMESPPSVPVKKELMPQFKNRSKELVIRLDELMLIEN